MTTKQFETYKLQDHADQSALLNLKDNPRMRSKLPPISDGSTGFYNDQNVWVCTGSRMGRADTLPVDAAKPIRMHLVRLPFVDGCYDQGGAYWGAPANLWRAVSPDVHPWRSNWDGSAQEDAHIELFVRARSRQDAKRAILAKLPQAKFYR